MASMLVPIRESGALLPQAIYARLLINNTQRHRPWRLGILLQFVASIFILIGGFYLQGWPAGIMIIVALTIWSLSRALCSLTNKDIQGKHVEQGNRGKLIGSASSISALITMLIALISLFVSFSDVKNIVGIGSLTQTVSHPKLLVLGGLALIAQAVCISIMWRLKTSIKEIDESSGDEQPRKTNSSLFSLPPTLSRFIVMRSLFSHSALLAPLFSLAYKGNLVDALAYLIVAQAAAGFLSSYVWGALSDKSALLCMQIGSFLSLTSAVILLIMSLFYTEFLQNIVWIVSLFFILSIGHAGVRTGRKIYSLDIAQDHERTNFVAKSNSAVGSFILIAGFAYSALMIFSINITLIGMSVGLGMGMVMSLYVKKEK